ncbi:hypothetical protein DY000_02060103 [Brassica cretica]|uniref:Uncharacterized protein n=1 Tax=Brassica cretica TaxID=69181 RepID=A0ABQ7B4F4_BRACR|nr:hypothetical protein DY000_02060103 [Brassica cretica]
MSSAATRLITSTYKLDRKGLAGKLFIRTLTPRRTTKGLIPSTRIVPRQRTRIRLAMDELEDDNRTANKPRSINTWRQSMHTARSLHSDRARAKLGRYVATKHAYRSVAT